MHHQRPHDRPVRQVSVCAKAAAIVAASLVCLAGAQPANTAATPPVVGIHYQDLLPADGDTIEVFLPRPRLTTWDGVMLSSSDECAELGDLGDPGPEHVLVLEVRLRGDHGALAPGESCSATITASYRSGTTTWDGVTLLLATRLAQPPAPADALEVTLTVDRIRLPVDAGARTLGNVITLSIGNRWSEPVVLLGLANPAGFDELVGSVYQYDEELDGTLARLQEVGRSLAPTTLAPGERTNVALVLDPGSRLPDGSAVITVQPALLLSLAGTTHSLRFERLSTAWGNELP